MMTIKPRIGLLIRKLGRENPKLGPAALVSLAAVRIDRVRAGSHGPERDEHRAGRKPSS
jgi:hypothetical protein